MTEIENLLIELIRIPSVTGQESVICDFIISKLSGLPVEQQMVSNNRANIIVRKGNSNKWLVCHVDTVPGIVAVRVEDDKIFGRGACDNKQSVAASILLAHELSDINILFTVGEEQEFDGARTAAESRICNDAELVIVQEPTNFNVITGQCGVISFFIETHGYQQHSSLSNMNNAIHTLTYSIQDLANKNWHAFNVGLISGGVAENVVAGSARAVISVRPKNNQERENILATLHTMNTVTIDKDIPPYATICKFPELIVSHFSEMAFFKNSIQFGAGDIRNAHTNDEYISRKDLHLLMGKLKELLTNSI